MLLMNEGAHWNTPPQVGARDLRLSWIEGWWVSHNGYLDAGILKTNAFGTAATRAA